MQKSIIATKETRQWQGIPAIECTSRGRLWCAFFSGGPKEPDPENFILLTNSEDNGASWSHPEAIITPPGATRAYDPALWRDPSGRLWLFYNLANLETKDFSVWAIHTANADSPHPHWSAPQKIDTNVPFAFRLNKPTVLSSGEWLLPVTWARSVPESWFVIDHLLQGVAISTDRGVSWTLHGAVEAPTWALENMIVERRDGRLWMLIRTGSGVIWQSFSDDHGQSWETGSATTIVNPGARFFIRRLASGRLLLINTPDPKRRQQLCAYLSKPGDDDTFQGGLVLDARDKVSYPDAVQDASGTIYAIHDCDRYGPGEIVLNIFSENEIQA